MKYTLSEDAKLEATGSEMTIPAGTVIEIDRKPDEQDLNYGDSYWSVDSSGRVSKSMWDAGQYDMDRLSVGNIFKTRDGAKAHIMRLRAAAKKWLPEDGEEYWHVNLGSGEPRRSRWDGESFDLMSYWSGNTHKTEAAAEQWLKEYGQYLEVKR